MKKLSQYISIAVLMLLISFNSNAQCNGGHSTDWSDAWVSCEGSENPNPARLQEHWIMYDFGSVYELMESHIWNYNVSGETDKGVQDIFIDHSFDGTNWDEWGSFTVAQASGSDEYVGEVGPDFQSAIGQYVLISVNSNWGDEGCQGFSEIKINVLPSNVVGVTNTSPFEFSVYPNPASDQITVQLEHGQDVRVQLISPTGQIVRDLQAYQYRFDIDINDLARGMYMVRVTNEENQSAISRVAVMK